MENFGIVELKEKCILNNKKVLMLGFGLENQQFLEWAINVVKFPISHFIIADKKIELDYNRLKLDFESSQDLNNIQTYLGDNYLDALENESIETVIKAPGIWSLHPKIQEFREKKGQDSVISSLYFFINKFRDNIIGVTGTKGKSTTCSLTKHLLNSSNFSGRYIQDAPESFEAIYCGNTTNISPYQYWKELDMVFDKSTLFIIELSSFQLQDIGYSKISPKYAIVTNYYIDHQDQHASPEEYWSAKNNIFKYQTESDFCILNEQIRSKISDLPNSKVIFVNSENTININENITLPLLGEHNKFNLSLVLMLYSVLIDNQKNLENHINFINSIAKSLSNDLINFKGLSHRLELFESFEVLKDDLKLQFNFYDDGAATEADATNEAVKSLTQNPSEFLWLIVTGKDKKSLKNTLIKTLTTIDQNNKLYRLTAAGEIGSQILYSLYQNQNINKLKEILPRQLDSKSGLVEEFYKYLSINTVASELKNNGLKMATLNICLSPSGSSLDEFTNYIERSNWFKEIVKNMLSK
jgi:UDP-N-acetylmuramoylalanine--D-glutamate ligase